MAYKTAHYRCYHKRENPEIYCIAKSEKGVQAYTDQLLKSPDYLKDHGHYIDIVVPYRTSDKKVKELIIKELQNRINKRLEKYRRWIEAGEDDLEWKPFLIQKAGIQDGPIPF